MELPQEINNDIQWLAGHYESSPIIKGLVQLIPFYGSAVDSFISVAWNNYKKKKHKIFFDELANGKIALTEGIVSDNDFLHAFFRTLLYVENNRTEEKVKRFAHILSNLGGGKINFNEFEEYTSAFDELTEREFAVLNVKKNFELKYPKGAIEIEDSNPLKITSSYWEKFKAEVNEKLEIDNDTLRMLLLRSQRTGCYEVHVGYMKDFEDLEGDTTLFFHKLLLVI